MLTSGNRNARTIVRATTTNVSLATLYTYDHLTRKTLRSVLRARYNDEAVLSDVLGQGSTVARRARLSFLYRHFVSIGGVGRKVVVLTSVGSWRYLKLGLRSFGAKDVEEGHRVMK
jgi:hypothetical protein